MENPRISAGTPALQGGEGDYREPVERPILRRGTEPAATCPSFSIRMAGFELGM